jgi:hypothetical protein
MSQKMITLLNFKIFFKNSEKIRSISLVYFSRKSQKNKIESTLNIIDQLKNSQMCANILLKSIAISVTSSQKHQLKKQFP